MTMMSVLAIMAYQTVFLGIAGAVCYRVGLRCGFARGEAHGMKSTLREVGLLLDLADDHTDPGRTH